MGTALLYQNDTTAGNLLAKEEHGQYTARLEAAIGRFTEQLEYIDRRAGDRTAGSDDLLLATTKAIMEMSDACRDFEQACGGDQDLLKAARHAFRERTGPWFGKSYFMERARTWPQGYAGDYLTLEGIYRDIPLSDGVGYYLDRYFLATTLPSAVRDRKELLRELLSRELAARNAPRVLDIACGSCREVFELAAAIRTSGAHWTCLDLDPDALAFSAERLAHAGIAQERLSFRRYNALKMVNLERNRREFGAQDVIYSVGFFDYLPDSVLVPLIAALYGLLNEGGRLILSFKDRRRYRSQEYHWFVDWDGFLLRTEEDTRDLLARAGIPAAAVDSCRDRSGVILFHSAAK